MRILHTYAIGGVMVELHTLQVYGTIA